MTEPKTSALKQRFQELERWATNYTAQLEGDLRALTGIEGLHCFVMDQWQEAFPEEHLSRDQLYVFIYLRLALDGRTWPAGAVDKVKSSLEEIRNDLQILSANFHEKALVVDLDWHVSEKERDLDQGRSLAARVAKDCELLCAQLERQPIGIHRLGVPVTISH